MGRGPGGVLLGLIINPCYKSPGALGWGPRRVVVGLNISFIVSSSSTWAWALGPLVGGPGPYGMLLKITLSLTLNWAVSYNFPLEGKL